MALEVVGHGANGVRGAPEQIDAAVAIKVHGKPGPAGRHELPQPHGARVAAAHLERIDVGAVGQAQPLLQLAAEEFGALFGARVSCREVKRQGGERVHHAEVAHLLAVDGLYPDDADDDLGGHTVFLLGAGQGVAVFLPKPHACADADGVDEAAAVHAPVLGRAFGGRQHELGHRAQKTRLAHRLAHPFAVQPPALCQVVGKLHGIVALGIGGAALHGVAAARAL